MTLQLQKQAEVLEVGELKVATCPVCSSYVSHTYFMQDASTKKKSKWFSCKCGVVFNSTMPTKVYDMKYWQDRSKHDKKIEAAYHHPIHIHIPLIEERVYGRRVLIVGRPNTYHEDEFARRGWVPTVIDKNTSFVTQGELIAADFETYKFPLERKYNLIWMYHTLDCMKDPLGALRLCHTLLAEDGIIVLMGADTDFINTRSSSCFIHWKHDENYLMWNRRSLTNHLEKLGFNVITALQNYEHRFPIWDDYHVIAQKHFF